MIILITFTTKMSIFSDTIQLSRFRGHFITILTQRSLRLLLFISINDKIYDESRQDLIILKDNILMLEYLRHLFFIIEINGLKAFRAVDRFIQELLLAETVRFTYCDSIHNAGHLFLCVSHLVKANIEDHACFREFISLLAYFE